MNRIILDAEVNHDPYTRQGTLQPTKHKLENLEIEHAANAALQLTFPTPELTQGLTGLQLAAWALQPTKQLHVICKSSAAHRSSAAHLFK